jgi:hypothetical protein
MVTKTISLKEGNNLKKLIKAVRAMVRTGTVNEAGLYEDDDTGDDIFAAPDDGATPTTGQPDASAAPAQDASQATPSDKAAPGVNVKGKVSLSKVATTDAGSSDMPEDMKNVDVQKVIDKLNGIRSGKSFKDADVQGQMNKYFDDLNDSERVALYAFLKGISQIVTGEVPAQDATDPHKHPADVRMHRTDKDHKKHIKPNVIRQGNAATPAPAPSPAAPTAPPGQQADQEDTSPPIVAKKKV